jgi:signal transduction histidine kinase
MLKDSVYDLKKTEQIAMLQASFESESKELENKQLKADQLVKDDRIRTQQFLIIAVSIISVLALLMASINFRQHRKLLEVNSLLIGKNKEIEKQNTEIEDQAEKLTALNKKLSDLNKSLESRIAMRTDQLKNQNHKLAEFAFMNAHQLRAPIARTMGLINLIQKIELPKEDKVLIKYLENCGKELDQITKDISKSLDEDSIFNENKED